MISIFLINLINYKKFKQLKKRFLLVNYTMYRSFLFFSKKSMFFNFFRKINTSSYTNSTLLPLNFFYKKMFYKNIKLLDILSKNNSQYVWSSGKFFKNIKREYSFIKTHNVLQPYTGGSNILIYPPFDKNILYEDIHLLSKHSEKNDLNKFNFNTHMQFNIFLLNSVEMYKIMQLLCLHSVSFLKIN